MYIKKVTNEFQNYITRTVSYFLKGLTFNLAAEEIYRMTKQVTWAFGKDVKDLDSAILHLI